MKIPKIGSDVRVEWLDSHVIHTWEYGDILYDSPHCFTRGILNHVDSHIVCIVPTNSETGGKMGVTLIPKGAIVDIKQLKEIE